VASAPKIRTGLKQHRTLERGVVFGYAMILSSQSQAAAVFLDKPGLNEV
jgi:hypothetical protein